MNNISEPKKENRYWPTSTFFRVWQIPNPDPFSTSDTHYGNTIEINIFDNVMCDAYIGGRYYSIRENCVVFIPPGIVHSFIYYEKSKGTVTALNIDPQKIASAFDIEAFLAFHNMAYADFPTVIPEYDKAYEIAMELYDTDELSGFIIAFMKFFQLFKSYINSSDSAYIIDSSQNEELARIISWSRRNYPRKIILDEVAAEFGYSKSYFCKKFKKLTGISFMQNINQMRVHESAKYLKLRYSTKAVADMCGFESTSYFIQCFKKQFGMTPQNFVTNHFSKT